MTPTVKKGETKKRGGNDGIVRDFEESWIEIEQKKKNRESQTIWLLYLRSERWGPVGVMRDGS
jgi:hypothetical protein